LTLVVSGAIFKPHSERSAFNANCSRLPKEPEAFVPTPQQLAQAYDLHLADRWRRKDESPGEFAQWLDTHWCADDGPEPGCRPDSQSSLGGAGDGLRVYCDGTTLRGFMSSRPAGCFRIDGDEVIPHVPRGRRSEAIRQENGP
jgi:hypothetical protein